MGNRVIQFAAWFSFIFALVCAVWAAAAMIWFVRVVDPPGKPRVPAAILQAVNVEKLHEFPGTKYPRLILNAAGEPDPLAEAANLAAFTRLINPPPVLAPYFVFITLCVLCIVPIVMGMIAMKRGRAGARRRATIAAVCTLLAAAMACWLSGAGLDSRALQFGGYVRQMESAEALSIAKWNEQIDLGRLPESARTEHSISWVLYDLAPVKVACGAGLGLLLAALLLAIPSIMRWLGGNIWIKTDPEKSAAFKA